MVEGGSGGYIKEMVLSCRDNNSFDFVIFCYNIFART
jgi:hypothetical protein